MNRLKARERNFENIALGQCYDWKNFFSVNLVRFFMITFFCPSAKALFLQQQVSFCNFRLVFTKTLEFF